jgi:NADPH2:quinone reductase
VVVFGASSGEAALTTHDLIFTHPVQVKGLHIGVLADSAPAVYRWLLKELLELVAQGVYPPGRPEVHALADGPELLVALEARRTSGKHALDPWS